MNESLGNSPLWLALLQVLVVIANAVLYARQKSRADVEKRDVEGFRLDLGQIRQIAEGARTAADMVNRDLYEALRTKYEVAITELVDCKARVARQEESLASLGNKLASRERADRHAAKRAADEEQEQGQEAAQPGGLDAATLAQLGAIPLTAQPAAPAAPVTSHFGKVLGRR